MIVFCKQGYAKKAQWLKVHKTTSFFQKINTIKTVDYIEASDGTVIALYIALNGGIMHQTTLKKKISLIGIGLHSGKPVGLTLRPAKANSGVLFHIASDCGKKTISPTPDAVKATGLATTLGIDGASVSTVEHLLASLRGLGIDNVHIDVNGAEIPIMDGSAATFVERIQEAGIVELPEPRKVLRVKKAFTVRDGEKFIKVEPYNGFFVDYTIDFAHKSIGVQKRSLELTPSSFQHIAKARTFGFLQDVEYLQKNGLALGGSLENAVVLDENGVRNQEGLRYNDEFVRHKILDFVGDMAMIGLPLQGKFTVHCSGHGLNNKFLRAINENASEYLEEVSLTPPTKASYAAQPDFMQVERPSLAFAR